jgi:hypothetical protein
MTEHFRLKHAGIDVKEQTEGGWKMQSLFGGRLRKWMGIKDRTIVSEENESAWKAVSDLLKRKQVVESTEKEDNVRLLNGFVARTRWDVSIKGLDKKKLMELAAVPKSKDRLSRIVKMAFKYFDEISDKLRTGDVLPRRKIESEGYEITLTITLTRF